MKIRPIGKSIIFQFVDETHGKYLGRTSRSGILIATGTSDQKEPKWGKVLAIGNEVTEVNADQYILIEPLQWTVGLYVDEERIWRTDESKVLAVSDERVLTV